MFCGIAALPLVARNDNKVNYFGGYMNFKAKF
jgi:hypothetical protein